MIFARIGLTDPLSRMIARRRRLGISGGDGFDYGSGGDGANGVDLDCVVAAVRGVSGGDGGKRCWRRIRGVKNGGAMPMRRLGNVFRPFADGTLIRGATRLRDGDQRVCAGTGDVQALFMCVPNTRISICGAANGD